jgi:hypothetical protein
MLSDMRLHNIVIRAASSVQVENPLSIQFAFFTERKVSFNYYLFGRTKLTGFFSF